MPSSTAPRGDYIGSEVCQACHPYIYRAWQSTRHSYSVLTTKEAQKAGYPLPQRRRGGKPLAIRTWQDVSYIIGGRQRITYINKTGAVLDSSYHHRVGQWDAFPSKSMVECGPCHFTGFGAGASHPRNPIVPGRWVERNIGCEACHGPGARHTDTYEGEDIVVDASSRLCGTCHTTVNRVLPSDTMHATHDLVQRWNHDRHVTGVQFHSHNAFCSRCHSPYEGYFLESRQGSKKRVFTETKQNITCIGCHNPHDLTHSQYSRQQVSLGPPLPSKLHTYRGNTEDFTASNFKTHETTEGVCVQCHRGADRIDLDHAHATCTDCHNTFQRNRGLESRIFHDANSPGLSCRPCHQSADHLMAILYRDPDFLQPGFIHNLRKLPAAVIAKHGFRYADLVRLQRDAPRDPSYESPSPTVPHTEIASERTPPTPETASERQPATAREKPRVSDDLRQLMARAPHARLAGDAELRRHQMALMQKPETIFSYLSLAHAYMERGEAAAAREMVTYARRVDSPRLLLELMPAGTASTHRSIPGEDHGLGAQDRAQALLHSLFAAEAESTRLWLQGYLEMITGRFTTAAQAFATAQQLTPARASLHFYLALAQLGAEQYDRALASLTSALEADPTHRAAQVARGLVHLQRKRLAQAREALEAARAAYPTDPVAAYFLGLLYLRQQDPTKAAQALQAALTADPSFIAARFALARLYRLVGGNSAAMQMYRDIIRRQPGHFGAHYQLASLLKVTSDHFAFRWLSRKEGSRPPGIAGSQWRAHLAALQRQSLQYGQLALSEFAIARTIRPAELETIRQVCEIYRRAERLEAARECFAWLAHQQPERWIHSYRLGTILVKKKHYEQAIGPLQQALALAPTQGDGHLALGMAYIRTGRFTEAIDILQQGTIYQPFHPALYTNLGAAYASRGAYAQARKALQRSLELETFPLPRVHLAYTNLALVHLHEGRHDDGIKALRTALHTFPDYRYAQELLAAATSSTPETIRELTNNAQFVFNDLLEIFGEVTTVAFDHE